MKNSIRKYLLMVPISIFAFTMSYTYALVIPEKYPGQNFILPSNHNPCAVTNSNTETKCDTTISCSDGDGDYKGKKCHGHEGGETPKPHKEKTIAQVGVNLESLITEFSSGGDDTIPAGPAKIYCDCNYVKEGETGAPGKEVKATQEKPREENVYP